MALLRLPPELLQHTALLLCADQPLATPWPVRTLLLVARPLRAALDTNAFWAALYDQRFDSRAIQRRCFNPNAGDRADQLRLYYRLLKAIRIALARNDRPVLRVPGEDGEEDCSTEALLFSAYLMMLENDGKNYAQLAAAGLPLFLDRFLRDRLTDGQETNQGWPLDNGINGTALMLSWMFTTREKLAAETRQQRDEFIFRLLPFVLCTQRYAGAEAPPNHHDLPLLPNNPRQQQPCISRIADDSPDYPHYISRSMHAYCWRRWVEFNPPLCTIAARLLFVSRKEMTPIRAPPHLPLTPGPGIVGLTQQDYAELNSTKTAKLLDLATWDWDRNRPVSSDPDASSLPARYEDSKRWDTEWWRKSLCTDYRQGKPVFMPGRVYDLGSISGSWQGRLYVPNGTQYAMLLANPAYPSVPDPEHPQFFTERSLELMMQPVHLTIEEHHRICGCSTVVDTISTTAIDGPAEQCQECQGCGFIPIPPLVIVEEPSHIEEEVEDGSGLLASGLRVSLLDHAMNNSWFPGSRGGLSFVKRPSQFSKTLKGQTDMRDEIVFSLNNRPPKADARAACPRLAEAAWLNNGSANPTVLSPISSFSREEPTRAFPALPPVESYVYETYDPVKISAHDVHQSSCGRCAEREFEMRKERERSEAEGKTMLDEMLRSFGLREGNASGKVSNAPMEDFELSGLRDAMESVEREVRARFASSGSGTTSTKGRGKRVHDEVDVQEDDGQGRIMSSGVDSGSTTSAKRKHLSGSVFSSSTTPPSTWTSSSSNSSSPSPPPPPLSVSVPDALSRSSSLVPDSDSDSDEDMSDLYLQSRVFGDDIREISNQTESPSIGESEESLSDGEGEPIFDRARVGHECCGVRDIVITGASEGRDLLWMPSTVYGRVRPWDGLIGMLRMVRQPQTQYFFVFGYIIGGDTFVGEWRFAATAPWEPAWSGPFVMSRKDDPATPEPAQAASAA